MTSPYYPPRARWYSRLYYLLFGLRRAMHLEKIHLPATVSSFQFIFSLLIPGYAFFAKGRSLPGWTFLTAYFLAVLLFAGWLGYPAGSIGYGFMISVHASSIAFLETYWLRNECRFRFRLAMAGLTLLAVWLLVYSPLLGFAERHWIMPLRVRENVVIVRRLTSPQGIKRGDWVMYSSAGSFTGDAHAGGAVWIRGGFGWGPVLGLVGDRVEFSTNSFIIAGVERPRLPHMPISGATVVPEKHWFIWPELDIAGHGNVGEAVLSATMLQLATVSHAQLIGKPFKHWFWRRQVLL